MAVTTAAVIGGVASAASAASSIQANKKAGSGGTPKEVRRYQASLTGQAKNLTQRVAGFNEDQQAAMQGVRDMQGMGQEDFATAQSRADQLAQGVTPEDIAQFYNPYENDVIGAYLQDLQAMRGSQDAAVSDAAQKAGAFGGDREAVYRASIQGDLDRTGAATLAGMRHAGAATAADLAFRNHGARLTGNSQFTDLINQRRGAMGADLNALNAVGAAGQALTQREYDAPLDTLRFRSEINNPGAYSNPTRTGPAQDPVAGALAGFQSGVRGVQGAVGAYQAMFPSSSSSYATPAPIQANPGPITIQDPGLQFPVQTVNWGT